MHASCSNASRKGLAENIGTHQSFEALGRAEMLRSTNEIKGLQVYKCKSIAVLTALITMY